MVTRACSTTWALCRPRSGDQVAILAHGLRDAALQQSLVLFCMAHCQAPVARAALFQADRQGFTILGEQV